MLLLEKHQKSSNENVCLFLASLHKKWSFPLRNLFCSVFYESPFLLVITSPCKMYLFRQAPFENIILLYSGCNVLIIIEKKIQGSQIFISSIIASVTNIASILFWKYPVLWSITAQKMKFSIKDFFSKCELKSRFWQIWLCCYICFEHSEKSANFLEVSS